MERLWYLLLIFACRLILNSAEEGKASSFSKSCIEKLWSSALQGRCKDWIGTHGDKVIAALLHCESDLVKNAAMKELKPLLKGRDLKQWSQEFVAKQPKHQKDHIPEQVVPKKLRTKHEAEKGGPTKEQMSKKETASGPSLIKKIKQDSMIISGPPAKKQKSKQEVKTASGPPAKKQKKG